MGVRIRYMGSKHRLAGVVAGLAEGLPRGPFLDLFSGMCSVAGALAETGRSTWCNDIQEYACIVASTVVAAQDIPRPSPELIKSIESYFFLNMAGLRSRFQLALRIERNALESTDGRAYTRCAEEWPHAGNDAATEAEVAALSKRRTEFPYRLAALTFSHGFFGLSQSLELDSIRYAIDRAASEERITSGEYNFLLVALLQTASQISSSPGHFAQYLAPRNPRAFERIRRLRRRSAWSRFAAELTHIKLFGNSRWRRRNKVFCSEAGDVLRRLGREGTRPAVIYADPPYSKAQYSRYYHVLESLTLYDYPSSIGQGRYRANRFQTPFSLKGAVRGAFESLIENCAALSPYLIVSYPTNGLLFEVDADPRDIMRSYYKKMRVSSLSQSHSTMGASSGRERVPVQEMIILGSR